MIRVRACTMRCRCQSNCRRSRFFPLGTQICGKRSSSSKRRISCASWRSVFCFRTRLARISAATPIYISICNSASNRSIELLRLFAMPEPFFLELSGVSIHRSNLLKLGVEIYSYNDHCSALSRNYTASRKLCCRSFDYLESEIGGFALEVVNLQFAVLRVVKLGSSVDELHSVAQHAIDQSSERGGLSFNGNGSPEFSSQSAKLCSQIGIA